MFMMAVFDKQLTKLLEYLTSALTSQLQPVPARGLGTPAGDPSMRFPFLFLSCPQPQGDFTKLSQVETKVFLVPLQAPSVALGLGPPPSPQLMLNLSQGPALIMLPDWPFLPLGLRSHS